MWILAVVQKIDPTKMTMNFWFFLEMLFNPKQQLGKHLHLDDISEDDCETMFRLENLSWGLNKQALLQTNSYFIHVSEA